MEYEYENKFFCIFFDDEKNNLISYGAIFNDNWKNAEYTHNIKNIIDKAEQHEEKITFPLTLYIPETEITDEVDKEVFFCRAFYDKFPEELSIFYISFEHDKDLTLKKNNSLSSSPSVNVKYLSYHKKIQDELENLEPEFKKYVSCKGLLEIARNRIKTSFWINLC